MSSKLSKSISSDAAATVTAGAAAAEGGAEMPLKDTLAGLDTATGEAVPLRAVTGDKGRSELADGWVSALGDATAAGTSTCCMKG